MLVAFWIWQTVQLPSDTSLLSMKLVWPNGLVLISLSQIAEMFSWKLYKHCMLVLPTLWHVPKLLQTIFKCCYGRANAGRSLARLTPPEASNHSTQLMLLFSALYLHTSFTQVRLLFVCGLKSDDTVASMTLGMSPCSFLCRKTLKVLSEGLRWVKREAEKGKMCLQKLWWKELKTTNKEICGNLAQSGWEFKQRK